MASTVKHLKSVKDKKYRGCRIVITKLGQGDRVWYDCMVFNAPLKIQTFTGDDPPEMLETAKAKVDQSLTFKPL
jgi:hypothetical protein